MKSIRAKGVWWLKKALFIVVVMAFCVSPVAAAGGWGSEILRDSDALKEANKALFDGNLTLAKEKYSLVSNKDKALYREATLGTCLCLALKGFASKNPDEAIELLQELIQKAGTALDLSELGDGSIFVNLRFIKGLLEIFETTGHLGAGDIAQGMMLAEDKNFGRYAGVIGQSGTENQKTFVAFFRLSMALSNATCLLAENDFEACLSDARQILAQPNTSEHITKSAAALVKLSERLTEVRRLIGVLDAKISQIIPDPGDASSLATKQEALGLAEKIKGLLKK
jgi:hypothetical protein